MITITDEARQKVVEFMKQHEKGEGHALRVVVGGFGPAGFQYEFFLDEEKNIQPGDELVDLNGLKALLDERSKASLEGATIDWKESLEGSGFVVDNPNEPSLDGDNPTVKVIQELLEKEINPAIASHGGFVQLIDVKDNRVYLQLGGGCQGCGMVDVTLKQGIEVRIKEALPQITEIVDTTDHAGGTNPYYSPGK